MEGQTKSLAIEEQIDIASAELMLNLRIVRNMSEEQKERIIRNGYEKIPVAIFSQIPDLVMDVCNREYLAEKFKEVGIDYANIQTKDSRLIRIAVVNHLLSRH